MKQLLAILLFIFDIILGPFVFLGVGAYLLVRYTFFNRTHWYDGILNASVYCKIMLKQFPTLYSMSYENMIHKVKA
jgi:hypothetical protein